ncbi:MAG: hypothetical protein AB1489_27240 [Acidobacteriota bacterium]
MASLLTKLKIKTQSMPTRCEVCHQADQFDRETNHCLRCETTVLEDLIATADNELHMSVDQELPALPALLTPIDERSVDYSRIALTLAYIATIAWVLTRLCVGLETFNIILSQNTPVIVVKELGLVAIGLFMFSISLFFHLEEDRYRAGKITISLLLINISAMSLPYLLKALLG